MGRFATAEGGGTDFKQAPAGTHAARCIGIIDIGTHDSEYQGQKSKKNEIIVRWELPFEKEEFEGQEKPLIVSKFYTNSLNEKANLLRDLESWRSRQFTPMELQKFDLEQIIGKPCTVSIVHNANKKAKVVAVSALPKGMQLPPQFNPSMVFWIEPWDDNKFQQLPAYFQQRIQESDEFKEFTGGKPGGDDDFDMPARDTDTTEYENEPPF